MNSIPYPLHTNAVQKQFWSNRRNKLMGVTLLAFMALSATAAVAGIGIKRNWFSAFGTHATNNAVVVQQQEQIEAELITVNRFGFMPFAIKRPANDFVMTIVNRSTDPELNLTLSRVVGNRPTDKVIDVKLKKGRGSWNTHFNLPPGDYELSELNHPDWKCKITLTPR